MGKCKVPGCPETHAAHYCRLCTNTNSTHFSQNCPQGRILYHGTRLSNIKGITEGGLKPSSDGRLGSGIYFAESFEVAESICQYRGTGTGGAVFECNVNLGKIAGLGVTTGNALTSWKDQHYDSARALHPPWAGAREFTEFCLKDAEKCCVRKVTVTNGHVENAGNAGAVVVTKNDKEWEKLKQLPENATFAVFNNFIKGTSRVVPVGDNPPRSPQTPALLLHSTALHKLFIFLKILTFLVTFSIQSANASVQREHCRYYSDSLNSLIVFIFMLTIVRIIYIGFLIRRVRKNTAVESTGLYGLTLGIIFFVEMPLMVSDAYVVRTCGKVDSLTLVLHISYFTHICLLATFDALFGYFCDFNSKTELCCKILGGIFYAICIYVPVYLSFADKPYDFKMDVVKIGSKEIPAAEFLVGIGTVGWGFWCVFFALVGLAILGSFCNK